jgi:hypothetical protein
MVFVNRLWIPWRLLVAAYAMPAQAVECSGDPDSKELSFVDRACSRLTDTWKKGKNEVIFRLHVAHAMDLDEGAARRGKSVAWGGGYGRTVEEANGNTHTVFGSPSWIRTRTSSGRSAMDGRRSGAARRAAAGLGYTR